MGFYDKITGKKKNSIDSKAKNVALETVCDNKSAEASIWSGKGNTLFKSGNFEEALFAFDRSIQIKPNDATAWNNRGLTLVRLNRFSEAVESYDKAH